MSNKIINIFLIISLFSSNIIFFATEDSTSDEIADLNEQMKEEEEEYKNQEEIEELQDEIDKQKETIIEINDNLIAKQKEINKLENKIPEYELQAENTLILSQKFYNSKAGLMLLERILENDTFILYISNINTIKKVVSAIKNETLILFDSIDELELEKEQMKEQMEEVRELEKDLINQLDTLKEEKKKKIISQSYQISYEFFNKYCEEDEVYGVDCGDELEEADYFKRPIKEGYVTNEFGGWDALNQDDGHTGIDITSDSNMEGYREVYPSAPGQVVDVFVDSYGGIQVMMIHVMDGKNYITNYAHLESVDVLPGDILTTEDQLGTMGETGVATGIHLHFEIIEAPYYIHSELENPRFYVTFPTLYMPFGEEEEEDEK